MSRYVGRFEKQPYEQLPYAYTPSDDMETGDTIVSATTSIVDAATGGAVGINDLTVVATAFGPAPNGDQVVVATLSKGISGARYKVTMRAVTGLGYKYEDDFLVTVRER